MLNLHGDGCLCVYAIEMIKGFDSKLQGLSRQVGSDWVDPPVVDIKTVGADLQSDSATSAQSRGLRADRRPDVSVACSRGGEGGPDTEGARAAASLRTRVLVLLIYGSFVLQ